MSEVKIDKKPATPIDPVVAKMQKAFPKAKLHKIRLDKSLGGDKKSVFVGVNGSKWQIPTGKVLEVPTPIYEVLEHMQVQMDKLEGVRDEIPNEA